MCKLTKSSESVGRSVGRLVGQSDKWSCFMRGDEMEGRGKGHEGRGETGDMLNKVRERKGLRVWNGYFILFLGDTEQVRSGQNV